MEQWDKDFMKITVSICTEKLQTFFFFFLFEHTKKGEFTITIVFFKLEMSNLKQMEIDKNVSSIDLLKGLDRAEQVV